MSAVTDQDERVYTDLQVKTWHSDVYMHFIMPPAIVMMDSGDTGYKFTCKWSMIISSVFCLRKFTLC